MKNRFVRKVTAIAAGFGLWHGVGTAALTTNTIFEQNFDSDTVGQLPSGWTGLPTVNNNAFVTNNVSQSAPNSLAIQITDSTLWTVAKSFPAVDLANGDPDNRLSYSLDINVDHIDHNNAEGINLRLFNGVSQIEAGMPRILRFNSLWSLYNGDVSINGGNAYNGPLGGFFNFNQWYNFRVVISPTSPTSGTADWYVDGSLINTETYSGRSTSQTHNMNEFDIYYLNSDVNAGTGALMYFDNLVIQSIVPEPSSVALLVVGGLILWRRRNTAAE